MIKYIFILTSIILLFITGCSKLSPVQKEYVKNKTYLYTQKPIWVKPAYSQRLLPTGQIEYVINKDILQVTDPFDFKAQLLPINRKVTLIGMNRDLVIMYRGKEIKFFKLEIVDHNNKSTTDSIPSYIDSILQPKYLDISNFSQLEIENIQLGEIAVGMSKVSVTIAIGTPSVNSFFSYKENIWTYGSALTLLFKNDRVIKIKDTR